eukprot:Protomagalhaensia_wolfi_Nauph_80__6155@NODE_8_length_5760_cov_41_165705_g6_i0_p3_GENE_NODE_8_length_5760_cov_41_165705_g6_i0NODE_8_length_5760_cov_41_165705_g6_i0_p3_ORF_typecomplete_len305_score37_53PAPS_reduct/PF01507_19/1_6e03PAPS_reduct/PF01507_19/2_1e27_NODE_8_length_5760_cov_41_165705_g6_i035394453
MGFFFWAITHLLIFGSGLHLMKTKIWDRDAYESALTQHRALLQYITQRKSESLRQVSTQSTEAGSYIQSETDSPGGNPNTLSYKELQKSLDAVKTSIRLYGTQGVISAFNGGKDATIVLDLYCAVLADHYHNHPDLIRVQPKAVYFLEKSEEFENVLAFVEDQRQRMDLDLTVCHGSITACIAPFLGSLNIKKDAEDGDWVRHPAFLLGVRRGDPRSEGLAVFEPSSDWFKASFMRVHPVFNWTYGMVWHYFETFKVPYCDLYDQGYTSLGKIHETIPNKLLSSLGKLKARDLMDWTTERDGRS